MWKGRLVSKGIPSIKPHIEFWAAFWNQSHIDISSNFLVSSQYALWRFTQAIQARVPYILKFNGMLHGYFIHVSIVICVFMRVSGMLFTANRPPNVDYRDWGGLNWWQNSRLSYYNMLAAGDVDLLTISLLEPFLEQLPTAQLRTHVYYEHSGAFWDEYNSFWGITHTESYGCGRAGQNHPPIWYNEDTWNHYNWVCSRDFFDLFFWFVQWCVFICE